MNKYETIMIIKDELTQEQKDAVIKKIEKYISENGKIESRESLGTKKLAYNIKNHKTGYYYIIEFESEPNSICELERIYRLTDEILKFIVVRKTD